MTISGQNYQAYNGQELSSLCQPRLSAVNMILPTFATDYCAAAAEHACTCYAAPPSMNISCMQGTQQQTHHMLLWDR